MRKTRIKRRPKGGNKSQTLKHKDSCDILDTQIKRYISNDVWKTCIRQNGKKNIIYYITPKNAIMKDIHTIREPKFVLNHNGKTEEFSVQIDEQYVSCFLYINGHWYVFVMINFAVIDNFRYYKLNDLKTIYDKNGTILLKHTEKKSSADAIRITKSTEVLKNRNPDVYELMNKFAIQKLLASDVKQAPADAVVFEFLDEI